MKKRKSDTSVVSRFFFLSLSILSLCIAGTASSQGNEELIPQISRGDIQFYVDCAGFKSFEDHTVAYEEIYLSVVGNQLTFVEEEGTIRAVAEVHVVLRDVRGSRVKTEHWKLGCEVDNFEEAQKKIFLFDVFGFMMKPGEYSLEVKVKDAYSGKEGSNTLKLEIPPYKGDKLMLSELQLAAKIEPDTSRHKFVKNGRRITPNPMRVYGINWPMLYFYAEIYNLSLDSDQPSTYTTQYAILDEEGSVVKEYPAKELHKPGASSIVMSGLNVITLPRGFYTFQVSVRDNDTQQAVVAQRSFQILKPASPEDAEEMSSEFTPEVAERSLDIIKYLASKDEQNTYKDLNLEGKRKFLEDFWKRRDPTPDTPKNEFQEEHFRRFSETNRLFTSSNREGWKTDFGRTFIVYGKPDDVERHVHEVDVKPFEIWYYYSVEGGIQFVFGDLDGFGNYTLIHSTARNEVNDPDYMRWLQHSPR
ncbi:MAG: GWxTD domain-containing protein [Gemmatimonadota bacterium]|nr:MAG: GWxTD domain-containing protein [Gemmatimonadota bacterium]